MKVNLIVACDLNNGIGKDGMLPWAGKVKDDLHRFKKLTMGHVVLMGRKTYQSIPKLEGRKCIVLSKSLDRMSKDNSDVHIFDCVENAMNLVCKTNTSCWVIGGGEIYEHFLKCQTTTVSKIYLTRIFESYQCDTFFPKLGQEFILEDASDVMTDAASGVRYQYVQYRRRTEEEQHIATEKPYLNLLSRILKHGKPRPDRTGTGTISLFGEQIRFDISSTIPALTTKALAWKTCIKELLWFMRGDTDAGNLVAEGVHIWDLNTTRGFLDARGLSDLPEGDIGAGYGFQWRHFGAKYVDCRANYDGQGVDQLANVIRDLKTDPYSRRIFMTAWNAAALDKMALPPCHVSAQFFVEDDPSYPGMRLLSCHMYQRSVDCFLGLPFNIFSYAVLTHLLAMWCDMKPKELIISTGDTHIYADHLEKVREQLEREPYALPRLAIHPDVKHKSIEQVTVGDFELIEYSSHPSIKAKMSA